MNTDTLRRASTQLVAGVWASRQRPIVLAGIPRTGSSWTGAVLSTAAGVRYYREPFNLRWQPEAAPFHLRYLRADDAEPAFDQYCRAAFAGQVDGSNVEKHAWEVYRRFPWWPGRVLVKEVHAGLALERVEAVTGAAVLVMLRHPCAVAASWKRLREQRPDDPHWRSVREQLDLLLAQEALMQERLGPFEDTLRSAGTYFAQVGALWGAFYQVVLSQQRGRPAWRVVRHEPLCDDPEAAFRNLFDALGLRWTARTDALIAARSGREGPYDIHRDPQEQAEKWQRELGAEEAREVLRYATQFDVAAEVAGL